jgi:hypothetical protein
MAVHLPCGCQKGLIRGFALSTCLRFKFFKLFDLLHGAVTLGRG